MSLFKTMQIVCCSHLLLGSDDNDLVLEWIRREAAPLPSVTENLHRPQEETQVLGDERKKMHFGSQTRDADSPAKSSTRVCAICNRCPRMESNVSESFTDLSVTDCAECLQVVQGALPSSAEHWLDVVHLPELPFPRVSYHLIKLQQEHKISTSKHTP